uniref:glutaminase liver isoform, mitochondrial isoform X3 n=1 Tax=Oncorhynchus gorbuscha TaxID=8017 RepID=UPI001EAEC609|nr:glutaminase liver isoform, mitochondrial isoform X3 [Oncorhynchus gorbuscha]
MEKTPSQDTEDNPYLCFQRTPSLRRKWRKRYGGLDGNKLLEPNKEEDMRENDLMTEAHEERNPLPVKGAESQDTASSGNVPCPMPRNSFQSQSQRPVNLVSPGSTGLPSLVSNGALKPPLPQAEQERPVTTSPQPWLSVGRTETTQGHSKRRAAADVLFDSFASDGRVGMNHFFETVWSSGLHRSDPRIKDCYFHMRKLQDEDGTVDRNTFQRCVTGFVSLILKALQGRFVIPDFSTFTDETQKLFMKCKQLSSVKQEKDSRDSAKWGVSVCTVDGQRLSLGDWAESCVLGEVSWPLVYGIAIDQLGVDNVHRYVGVEEFSKYDSPFTLTKQGVPHSPLIETGAIITTSLLQLAASLGAEEEEKYESVLNAVKRLCNKEHANLNCTSYQSLRKDSIRLHALSFYLQEKKCFPETVDINATLDLMLQCASTEVTCESGAAMAASLANGGLCPLSGDQVLSPSATKSMLSMMQVAGMNDYSRIFNFKELISTFQLHSFDIRTPFRQVLTYRQWKAESEGYQIMNILLAAFKGDIQSLRRYFLSGADVNAVDYDGRSALHVAASEGHSEVIRFLVENTGTNYSLKDRWGNTPMQEAMKHSHGPAAQLLKKYEEQPVTL